LYWVGSGWVSQLMGWVGSSHTKWTMDNSGLATICHIYRTPAWTHTEMWVYISDGVVFL